MSYEENFQTERKIFSELEEAEGEDKIIIVGDNKKICKNDFVPNKEIMDNLFNNLLDHHPKYMPPKVEGNPLKKQKQN